MPYILKRTNQWGGYVALPGRKSAYVPNPAHARKFATRELAEASRCVGNEVVVPYEPKKAR